MLQRAEKNLPFSPYFPRLFKRHREKKPSHTLHLDFHFEMEQYDINCNDQCVICVFRAHLCDSFLKYLYIVLQCKYINRKGAAKVARS